MLNSQNLGPNSLQRASSHALVLLGHVFKCRAFYAKVATKPTCVKTFDIASSLAKQQTSSSHLELCVQFPAITQLTLPQATVLTFLIVC